VIYRRYASLFFIVGTKPDVAAGEGAENTENELGMLEFIHNLVETMDKWAGSICEVRASKQARYIVHCLPMLYCVANISHQCSSFF
jgi:hypothetical protein